MKVIIVTGNKGGVGKSCTAVLLASHARRYGKNLIVGDAEASKGQATFGNIMSRVIPSEDIKAWRLESDEGFGKMLDDLEPIKNTDAVVVVDTGASMMFSLSQNLALLAEARDELNIDVEIVFAAGPLPDSAAAARSFIREQLTIKSPIKTTFLLLSPSGETQDRYAISSVDIDKGIGKIGGRTAYIGTIRQDFFAMIMKDCRLPDEILADATVGYGTKKQLSSWLSHITDPIFADIFKKEN